MIPSPLARQYVRISRTALQQRDTGVLTALLNEQIRGDRLRTLRRAIDLRFDVAPETNLLADPMILRFLRGAKFGAGFFLPLRSPILGAYALAQLDSLTVVDHDNGQAVGVVYRPEELIEATFRLAAEAMRYCVAAGLSEEAASQHCWELEVELSARFAID